MDEQDSKTIMWPKIPGGFAPSWRKELQSEVWQMPPIYHRVWYWIRMNVQHEITLFPTRGRFGIWLTPGQRITSLQAIAEGVKWAEWGKELVPNKKTIKSVLEWLESREMVTVESNAKGTLISVVNWHIYNINNAEKVTAESNAKGTRTGHKEECKEGKEVKIKPMLSECFETLWRIYPDKDGKKEAIKHFNATVKSVDDCQRIKRSLDNYLLMLRLEAERGFNRRPKGGKSWFHNWQDWEHWQPPGSCPTEPVCSAEDELRAKGIDI